MTSHPPAQCCTVGVLHEGTPSGSLQTIAGTETYVATPKNPRPSVALLLITDVIGHKFNNAQLIADQFAANGFPTFVPDMFQGDPVPLNRGPTFELQKWLSGAAAGGKGPGHGLDVAEPIVKKALEYIRCELGAKKVGMVGYCYGGKFVIRELGAGTIDVGYTAHPSFVTREELEQVKGPLSISAAETDEIFTPELRHETEEVLKSLGNPWQLNVYSGVSHGFSVRGDVSDRVQKYAKEAAFLQAIQWFDEWLKV